MAKLKIHILFEHGSDLKPFGCAYIRNILPLRYPTNADKFEVTYGLDYQKTDVLIVERLWKPGLSNEVAEQLCEQAKKDQTCLIYSIDDNLIDLPSITIPQKMLVRYFARMADGVIVSTQALKDRFSQLNKNVCFIPNALDENLFTNAIDQNPSNNKPRLTIGYMGTFTHDADLMLVAQSLRKILKENPDSLEFQIVGGLSNSTFVSLMQGLPVNIIRVPTVDVEYPYFVKWMIRNLNWDLGIAPLESTHFNTFKSDIKFLDYSMLGIPGLFSYGPSYASTVEHLKTGYLVEEDPKAWYQGLKKMLDDPDFRLQIASNGRDFVLKNRTLKQCAINWQEAIEAIYENHA